MMTSDESGKKSDGDEPRKKTGGDENENSDAETHDEKNVYAGAGAGVKEGAEAEHESGLHSK